MKKREDDYGKLDLTRKQIIKAMWNRESLSISEIRGRLPRDLSDMTRYNVYKHLKVLLEFGFVEAEVVVNEGVAKTRPSQFATVFMYSLTNKGEHAADYFFGK